MRRCFLWSEQKSPMSFSLLPTWRLPFPFASSLFCTVAVLAAVVVSSHSASSLSIRPGRILLLCRLLGSCRYVASTLRRRCIYGLAEYCCVVYLAAAVVSPLLCVVVVYTAWLNTVAVSSTWQLSSLSRPILRHRLAWPGLSPPAASR
jgi:hypothetical protein